MKKNTLILGVSLLLIGLLVLANSLILGRGKGVVDVNQLELQGELVEQGEDLRERLLLAHGALPATFLQALEANGLERSAVGGEEPSGVAGFVLAAGDNSPISDVEVVIVAQPPIRVSTDSEGFFHYENVKPRYYTIFFSAKGWAATTMRRVQVEEGKTKYLSVLLDRGQQLSVHVSGPQTGGGSAAIEGAEVGLHYGGREANRFVFSDELEDTGLWGRTDSAGFVRFDQGSFGVLFAVVRAPGYPVWLGDLSFRTPNETLMVELASGGTIEGAVSSSEGGIGVGYALLAPFGRTSLSRLIYAEGYQKLDESGRFRFEGIPAGDHSIAAVLSSGETAASSGPVIVSERMVTLCNLQGIRPSSMRGRITDTEGLPLEGVEVYLPRPMLNASTRNFPHRPSEVKEQLNISVFSGPDGWYRIDGIPSAAGNVMLAASKDGYTQYRAYPEIDPNAITEFSFFLAKVDSFVAGRIEHADGGQVAGLTVYASVTNGEFEKNTFQAKTDSEGKFRIDVPSTVGSMRVFTSGRRLAPPARFDPKAFEGVFPGDDDLLFVANSKYILRGRVVGINGDIIRTLEISIFSDVDGGYSSNNLMVTPGGQFEIAIDADRYLFLTFCSAGYEPTELWSPGLMIGKDVLIQLKKTSRTLDVQVVDALGNPFEGAAVALSWHNEIGAFPIQSTLIPSGVTGADGKCTLRGVPTNAPSDFLVAPGVNDQPPLLHFLGRDVPTQGGLYILQLDTSEEVTIDLKTSQGEAALGGCLVLSSDNLPISPKLFRSLSKGLTEQGKIDVRPVQGQLKLRLCPGSYKLVYLPKNAPAGAIQTIDFEVNSDANIFTFFVE